MSRLAWILTALVAVLVGVLWWFLLWSPTSDEIEQLRAETETTRAQVQQQRAEEARLRQIRQEAPEAEAALAASQVIVPSDAALPALLRQVQQASDDAGVRLLSISPGRPSEVGDAPGGLATMTVSFNIEGTYFQIIDLARRLEDPVLTGRGLVWNTASFSIGEYPTLGVSLSAQVLTRVVGPAAATPPEDPATEEPAPEDGTEPVAPTPTGPDEDLEIEG